MEAQNYFNGLDPKKAIEKAKIYIAKASKENNTSQGDKIAGQLKSYLDTKKYNWKSDPHALELLGDFVNEKLVVTSTDGTEKTLTSDDKMKAKKALDSGDEVEIKKKGDPIQEDVDVNDLSNNLKSLPIEINGRKETVKVASVKGYSFNKNGHLIISLTTAQNNLIPNNIEIDVDTISSTVMYDSSSHNIINVQLDTNIKTWLNAFKDQTKKMQKVSEGVNEESIQDGKNVNHVKQLVKDAATELDDLLKQTQDKRYSRIAQGRT